QPASFLTAHPRISFFSLVGPSSHRGGWVPPRQLQHPHHLLDSHREAGEKLTFLSGLLAGSPGDISAVVLIVTSFRPASSQLAFSSVSSALLIQALFIDIVLLLLLHLRHGVLARLTMTTFWNVDGLFWLLASLLSELLSSLLSSPSQLAAFFFVNPVGGSLIMGITAMIALFASTRFLLAYLFFSFRAFSLGFVGVEIWTTTGHPVFPTMFLLSLLLLQVDPRDPAPETWIDAAYMLATEIAPALPMVLIPLVATETPPMVERALSPILRSFASLVIRSVRRMFISVPAHAIRSFVNPLFVCVRCVSDQMFPMLDARMPKDKKTGDFIIAEFPDEQLPPSVTTGLRSQLQTNLPGRLQQLIRERDDSRLSPQDQRRLFQLERLVEDHTAEYERILGSAPSRTEPPRRVSPTFDQGSLIWPRALYRLPRRFDNDEGADTEQHSQCRQKDARTSRLAAIRDAAGAVPTVKVSEEPTSSTESESDGEEYQVEANDPESSQEQEGEALEMVAANDPQSSSEQQGEAEVVANDPSDIGGEAVANDPSDFGGEAETTHVQPEYYGDWVSVSSDEASDSSREHGAVEAAAPEPESPRGLEGEGVVDIADHEAQGGSLVGSLIPAATPQTLGAADCVDVPDNTPPAIEGDDLAIGEVARVSRRSERSPDRDGRNAKRQRQLPIVSSPEMTGEYSSAATPQQREVVPAAELLMEWEATGATSAAEEPHIEDPASLFQPPMDFREPMEVEEREDDEMEYSWTQEWEEMDLGGHVGQEEDGALADLTAKLQRLTLWDGEESDVAMVGVPEAVLEVVQDGHHETAPQSSEMTLDELLHAIDVEMADSFAAQQDAQLSLVNSLDDNGWDQGEFDEGQFAALLDEGLQWDTSAPNLVGSAAGPVAPQAWDSLPLDFLGKSPPLSVPEVMVVADSSTTVVPEGPEYDNAALGMGESCVAGPDGQQQPDPVPAPDNQPPMAEEVPEPAAAVQETVVADDSDDEITRALVEALTNLPDTPLLAPTAGAVQFEDSTAPQISTQPEADQPVSSYPSPPQPASPAFQPSPPRDAVSPLPIGLDGEPIVGELFTGPPPGMSDAEVAETGAGDEVVEEEKREPVINTPAEIAQRPKLLPRSRRRGRLEQQEPLAVSPALPDTAAVEDKKKSPDSKGKGKEPAAADTVDSQPGPGDCPIPIDPQLWATYAPTGEEATSSHHQQQYPAPIDMGGGLLIPGGNTKFGPAPEPASIGESSSAVPATPVTLPASQVTGSPAAGGAQSKGDADKTPRRAKALPAKKKPSLFLPKKKTAPSTPYGTRAPGSAEKERQFRSSQTLDGMDRMALDETGEASRPHARELAIAPISFVKQTRPPSEEESEEELRRSIGFFPPPS
ncbi:hypothetical protein L249_0244, partial [Ophiocordyceps polyrhachis-furcata BCC 54312]